MRKYQFPNPETEICVSIGYPVIKQKTLYMHNAGFEFLGLNYIYLCREIKPETLKEGVSSLREIGIKGVSVTMPHKVEIIKYIDICSDEVKNIGSCNTILNDNGVLKGYNSDFIGALNCLKRKTDLKGKRVLVLGAGGTSRAIVYGLVKEGADIIVLNRDVEKAKKLANDFNVKFGNINDKEMYMEYDVIINATSVGSRKEEDCDCLLCEFLKLSKNKKELVNTNFKGIFLDGKIALDVVFQRHTTEFIEGAKNKGFNVIYGHEMLVEQGSFQFNLFTGCEAPKDIMYMELKKNLEDW